MRTALTLAGQLSAFLQGTLWMILVGSLIGILFVPMAWIAAVVARRNPGIAVALLLIPVGYLVLTWAPDSIVNSHPISSGIAIVAAFTLPALVASACIWFGRRHAGSSTVVLNRE